MFNIIRNKFTGNLKANALENWPPEAWKPEMIDAVDELYERTAMLYTVENTRANQVVAIPRAIENQSGETIEENDLPFKLTLVSVPILRFIERIVASGAATI